MQLGECFLRSHSEAGEFGEEEVGGRCFGHFLQSRKVLRLSRCTLIMYKRQSVKHHLINRRTIRITHRGLDLGRLPRQSAIGLAH